MNNTKKVDFVLIAYAVTLMSMLLFLIFKSSYLNYIKYAYVGFMLLITLRPSRFSIEKSSFAVVSLFLIHTLLFGYLIVPSNLSTDIHDNAKELIFFWLFIYTTANYIHACRKENKFLFISHACISIFLIFCYLTHFNGIAPLKYVWGIFNEASRVRFTFGLSASNRAGYLAFSVVILSLVIFKNKYRPIIKIGQKTDLYKLFLWLSIIVGMIVVFSTQTRGAFLAIFLFIISNKLMNVGANKSRIIKYVIFFGLIILVALYGYYIFVSNNSRSYYLNLNWLNFKENSNNLFGLGYTSFSYFLTGIVNVRASPLDCYYLYIICSTGYIGAAIIFSALIYVLYRFLKRYLNTRDDKNNNWVIALFMALLFIGFTESLMAAPYVMQSYVFWIIILSSMMKSSSKLKQSRV